MGYQGREAVDPRRLPKLVALTIQAINRAEEFRLNDSVWWGSPIDSFWRCSVQDSSLVTPRSCRSANGSFPSIVSRKSSCS